MKPSPATSKKYSRYARSNCLLGIFDSVGSLETGKAADIVILDADFNVQRTFVAEKNNRQ